MKATYTKAKWQVADYLDKESGKRSLAVWSEEKTICLVSPKESETLEDVFNAKLIAYSPEILHRLKMIVEATEKVLLYPKGAKGYDAVDAINLEQQIDAAKTMIGNLKIRI